jgi:hypothetical protein
LGFFTVVREVFDVQRVRMENGGKSCTFGEVELGFHEFCDMALDGGNLASGDITDTKGEMEGWRKVVLVDPNLIFPSNVTIVYLGHHGGDLILKLPRSDVLSWFAVDSGQ